MAKKNPSSSDLKLRKIESGTLVFGKSLPYDLYDAHGHLFRQSGLTLHKRDLLKARKRLGQGLFVREDDPAFVNQHSRDADASRQIRSLVPGQRLPVDVLDEHGRLIQASGTTVTPSFLQFIKYRPIRVAETKSRQVEGSAIPDEKSDSESDSQTWSAAQPKLSKTVTHRLDQAIQTYPTDQPAIQAGALRRVEPALELPALREQVQEGAGLFSHSVQTYAQIANDAIAGKTPQLAASTELIQGMSQLLDQDPNLAILIMDLHTAPGGDYLFNHSMNTALVAMRVASKLGWSADHVKLLGLAALMSDIGMLHVTRDIRFASRSLTEGEWLNVRNHPLHSVHQLDRIGQLNPLVMLVVFQAHERCDGSGYPHQCQQTRIHPLARILAASDMYAAMTCPRPHRMGHLPYQGMLALLHEARTGRMDRQVIRAFLESLSLFPVGSYVRLSDGSAARVIRNSQTSHALPLVIPLNSDGTETDTTLDLAQADSFQILAALSSEEATGRCMPPPLFSKAS